MADGSILEKKDLPTGADNISLGEECLTLAETAPAVPFIAALARLGHAERVPLKLTSPFSHVHTCAHTRPPRRDTQTLVKGHCAKVRSELDGNVETGGLSLLRISLKMARGLQRTVLLEQ